MGRMANPPHPGQCLQDSLHDARWTVSEAARRGTYHIVPAVAWTDRDIGRDGARAGADRLEQHRVLVAPASELRLGHQYESDTKCRYVRDGTEFPFHPSNRT